MNETSSASSSLPPSYPSSSSISSSSQQQECCRICHGESEPDRPLFHPCKCSGSIKFIHQDCLKEWLKISGSGTISLEQKCELCGEKFQFKSIYSTGEPPQLTITEFLQGLWPILMRFSHHFIEHSLNGFCWLGLLPFLTSWWLEICSCIIFKKQIHIYAFMYRCFRSPSNFIIGWWNGVLATSIVTVVSILLFHAFQSIQQEIHIRMAINDVNRGMMHENRHAAEIPLPGADIMVDEWIEQQRQLRRGGGGRNDDDNNIRQPNAIHGDDTHNTGRVDALNNTQHILDHNDNNRNGRMGIGNNNEENLDEDRSSPPGVVYHLEGCLIFDEGSDDEGRSHSVDEASSTSNDGRIGQHHQDDDIGEQEYDGDVNDHGDEHHHQLPAVPLRDDEPLEPAPINAAAGERGIRNDFNEMIDENEVGFDDEEREPMGQNGINEREGLVLELNVRRFLYHLAFNFLFILALEVFPVLVGRACFMIYAIPDSYINALKSSIAVAINEHRLIVSELVLILDLSSASSFELTEEVVFERVIACFEAIIGYTVIIFAASVIALFIAFRLRRMFPTTRVFNMASAYISNGMELVQKWVLMSMILFIELMVLPQLIGWLIDLALLPAFNSTLSERLYFWMDMPLVCAVVHWLVGFMFMFCMAIILIEIRDIIRFDLLRGILPVIPQEIDENSLNIMAATSFKQLVIKELINLCFYLTGVVLCIMVPVQFGHYLFPTFKPLTLRFNDVVFEVQLPLEMVVFHVLVPFALDHLRFRAMIHGSLRSFLFWACNLLDVNFILEHPPPMRPPGGAPLIARGQNIRHENDINNDIADNHDNNNVDFGAENNFVDEYGVLWIRHNFEGVMAGRVVSDHSSADHPSLNGVENNFSTNSTHHQINEERKLPESVRLCLFGVVCLFTTVLVSSWLMHAPITVGRTFYQQIRIAIDHDLFNYTSGLVIIWFGARGLRYLLGEMEGVDFDRIKQVVSTWGVACGKVLIFASVWLTIVPFFIGVAFEAIAVVPLRTARNETPRYPLVQCWALGLVFLKIWTRCLLLGGFGDNIWKTRFERVINQGVLGMDLTFVFKEIVFPVLFTLGDFIIIPYFVSRLLGILLKADYETRSLLVRYSFLVFALLRLAIHALLNMSTHIRKLYNDIRDSRYLVGTELTNR